MLNKLRQFYQIKLLILILILGFLLRVVLLDKYPPSLNWDEISHGYNAYSILKTGADEWGKVLPLTNFRAYGDYPLPLNLYLTIPFIALFGLGEFAIRFPHAILGTLTILSAYFLANGFFKDKSKALLVSMLVSITPWYVFTSRFVVQSNISVFLLVTAMAAFFNRQKNKYLLPLSLIFLGLTLFSYHSTRIFTPLLLIPMFIIYRKQILTKLSVIILLIFILPLPFILANPEARARSNVVFIINQGIIDEIEVSRNTSHFSPLVSKILYNKPVFFVREFSKNYLDYFSPKFLFLSGGTQYQFSVPETGLLYLVNLPFFYIGVFFLLKKALKGEKDYIFILVWLLLAPIPASITTEAFAVLRSTPMLPLSEILIVVGLFEVWQFLKNKKLNLILLSALYLGLLAVSLEGYLTKYFGEYPKEYSWAWQYGYKEVTKFATDNYQKYDKIIFTKKYGEPHEFVLFNNKWDPIKYRQDPNLIRYQQSNWYWVDRFDKYYFVNDWQVKDLTLESGGKIDCIDKCLLITSPGNFPEKWSKLETTYFLDGKPAFEIYENE